MLYKSVVFVLLMSLLAPHTTYMQSHGMDYHRYTDESDYKRQQRNKQILLVGGFFVITIGGTIALFLLRKTSAVAPLFRSLFPEVAQADDEFEAAEQEWKRVRQEGAVQLAAHEKELEELKKNMSQKLDEVDEKYKKDLEKAQQDRACVQKEREMNDKYFAEENRKKEEKFSVERKELIKQLKEAKTTKEKSEILKKLRENTTN